MAGFNVSLRIATTKPAKEDLAFLGPMNATAAYNADRLMVSVEVEAADVVEALVRARSLVIDRLPGEVEVATVVAVDDLALPPGRLFGRKRN